MKRQEAEIITNPGSDMTRSRRALGMEAVRNVNRPFQAIPIKTRQPFVTADKMLAEYGVKGVEVLALYARDDDSGVAFMRRNPGRHSTDDEAEKPIVTAVPYLGSTDRMFDFASEVEIRPDAQRPTSLIDLQPKEKNDYSGPSVLIGPTSLHIPEKGDEDMLIIDPGIMAEPKQVWAREKYVIA
jgi:hypothetical protein